MASSSRSARNNLVTIGRIGAPHGLRGEVRVHLETDFPQRFEGLREAFLMSVDAVVPVVIAGQRPHRGGVLLTIEGVTDVNGAERLRGAQIAVRRDAAMPLGPSEFYVFEVIGLRVRTADGRALGIVTAVIRTPANDVYVVRGGGGEILIPALRAVVQRVDRAAGEMTVDLPEGLEVDGRAR